MEKDMKEVIDSAVTHAVKEAPDINKEELAEALRAYFEERKPFYKSFNINEELIEQLYSTAYQEFQSGKFNDALASFEVLNTLDPTEAKYIFGKALCFKELKKMPQAVNEFIRLGIVDYGNPIPYWHMYECYDEMNDLWGAGAALGAVVYLSGSFDQYADLKQKALVALNSVSKETAKLPPTPGLEPTKEKK